MLKFKQDNLTFNYRIAGVSINKGKVLLHRVDLGVKEKYSWSLPGGHAEFLEDSKETLTREYREELGFDVEIGKMIWFVENFLIKRGATTMKSRLFTK